MSASSHSELGIRVPAARSGLIHHFLPARSERSQELSCGAWSLHIHDSIEALESLESPWRSLTSEGASPFQTYSWNLAWCRTFLPCARGLLIFELRKKGETAAILPCYRAGLGIRLAGDRTCDYQDAIAGDGETVAMLLGLAAEWLRLEAPLSHFHFAKLSSEGLLFRVLHELRILPEGTMLFERARVPCPFVEIRGGLDDYLASLPRKTRQDFKHSLNRLEKEAPVSRVTILRDFEIGVDDLVSAADFHTGHFRKKGIAPFRDPRLLNLLGEVAKDPDTGLQLSFLTNYGDIFSVDFGFARGGRYYGYLTAFDPAHARFAPGKCLLLKRIDSWVWEDGVQTLDFLGGGEGYKRNFTGDSSAYRVWSMRLMPRDLPNQALRLALESDKQLRRLAKSALQKAAILPR